MASRICPECGCEISDSAKFCVNCGHPLGDLQPEAVPDDGATDSGMQDAGGAHEAQQQVGQQETPAMQPEPAERIPQTPGQHVASGSGEPMGAQSVQQLGYGGQAGQAPQPQQPTGMGGTQAYGQQPASVPQSQDLPSASGQQNRASWPSETAQGQAYGQQNQVPWPSETAQGQGSNQGQPWPSDAARAQTNGQQSQSWPSDAARSQTGGSDDGGGKKKIVIIAIVAVVAVVAVVAICLAVFSGGGDEAAVTDEAAEEEAISEEESAEPEEEATEEEPSEEDATGEGDASTDSAAEDISAETLAWLEGYGTFEETTVEGTGDQVVDVPNADVPFIATITYGGDGNFEIDSLDSSGENNYEIFLYNSHDSAYEGTTTNLDEFIRETDASERTAKLSVEADGDWSITFKPLSAMEELVEGQEYEDSQVLYVGESADEIVLNYSGSGYVNIYCFTAEEMDYAFNADGAPFEATLSWVGSEASVIYVSISGSSEDVWTANW